VPLRLRLALIVAAGLTALLVASGFAFVRQLRDSLTASIDTALWSQRHALLVSRPVPVTRGRHSLGTLPGGTQLLTAGGTVLAWSADDADDGGSRPLLTPAQAARARRGPLWLTRSYPGAENPVRLLAFPLPSGSRAAVAVVSSSTELLDEAVDHVEEGFLFGGPVVVVGGAFAGWLLTGAALRPVERMRRQAAQATAAGAVPGGGPVLDVPATRDEIAALARTMNELLERLRTAVARERAFVADAGHELRTPLSILRTELELAARPGRTREELSEAIRSAAEETDRLARLAEGLLLLAREQDERFLHRERVGVRAVLEASIAGLQVRAQARQARITLDVGPRDLTATWDEDLMRQVLANLIDNALRHGPRHGTIRVSAAGFAGRVVLRVEDNGPGFPDDFLPRAFERFSRADAARGSADGGAGLGLAIVDLIVRAHGGRVQAGNRPEGGAVVTAEIPEPAPPQM